MSDDNRTVDLGILQQEVNNLVEQRLTLRGQLVVFEEAKKRIKSEIDGIESHLLAIDTLFKEKLDELNKYRGQ